MRCVGVFFSSPHFGVGVIASYSRPQSLETSYAGAVASLATFIPICVLVCTLQKKDWFATSTKFEFPAAADAGVDCFDMIHINLFWGNRCVVHLWPRLC